MKPFSVTPRRLSDAALEAEARHPGAGADAALLGSIAGPRALVRLLPRRHHVVAGDLHPSCVAEVGVVALADDGYDHVVADAGMRLHIQLAHRVVHTAELHRRRQHDRCLDEPPLGRGDEAGALASAVEDRPACRQRPQVGILSDADHGHACPRDAAARWRRWLVADDRRVADADARDVGRRIGRARRQRSDGHTEVADCRHTRILPKPGTRPLG